MTRFASGMHRVAASALLVFVSIAAAYAADPFARATLGTQDTIYTGQQITVQVDVLVPNFFMSPPKFPLFDLPNAVVSLPDSGAQNLNETVDGESYVGIRRSYLITPQAAGDFVLPPAEITFTYAAVPGQPSPGKVTLPPIKFAADRPPGAEVSGDSVMAARVSVGQTLDRDAEGIKVGDALVRTITVTADGMQAMMIPEPSFEAPEGVRVYPHDPTLDDQRTPRGEFVAGRRTDTATYVFVRAGSFTLPPVEIHWFDAKSGSSETASAPAVSVTVMEAATGAVIEPPAPADEPQSDRAGFDWRRWLPWALAAVAAFAATGWLLLSGGPHLLACHRAKREKSERSEQAYFHRFERACRSGDGRVAYRRLDEWARSCDFTSVSEWLRRYGDAEAQGTYATFEESIFGSNAIAAIDTGELGPVMARARHSWLARKQRSAENAQALPRLNPRWVENPQNQQLKS